MDHGPWNTVKQNAEPEMSVAHLYIYNSGFGIEVFSNSEQDETPKEGRPNSVSSHKDHMMPTRRLLPTPEQTVLCSSHRCQMQHKCISLLRLLYC